MPEAQTYVKSTWQPAKPAVTMDAAEPVLSPSIPGGGRYVGRVVIEVWEPADTQQSDGLAVVAFGLNRGDAAKAQALIAEAGRRLVARSGRH